MVLWDLDHLLYLAWGLVLEVTWSVLICGRKVSQQECGFQSLSSSNKGPIIGSADGDPSTVFFLSLC